MDTIELLQQIATTPRYGQPLSELIYSQPKEFSDYLLRNNKFFFKKHIFDDDEFQANTIIQVDL